MTEKLLPCPFCGGDGDIADGPAFGFSRQYQPCCRSCGITGDIFDTYEKALGAWNRRAQPENKPLTRCENCTHWDKSISFMMSAHACSYWSPSKRSPRYTEGFEFCSFASAKPERSEGE